MNSPVYIMMKPKEQYEIVLVAIMDLMLKNLKDRYRSDTTKTGKSRLDRFTRIHDMLTDVEQRYEGALPDSMINKADRFNKLICSDLSSMAKMISDK